MIRLTFSMIFFLFTSFVHANEGCYKYFSDKEMKKIVGKVCLKPSGNTSPQEYKLTNYSMKYRIISQTEVESLGLKFDYSIDGLVLKRAARCPCNRTSYAKKNDPAGVFQLSFNQTSEYFADPEYGTIDLDASKKMYYLKQ